MPPSLPFSLPNPPPATAPLSCDKQPEEPASSHNSHRQQRPSPPTSTTKPHKPTQTNKPTNQPTDKPSQQPPSAPSTLPPTSLTTTSAPSPVPARVSTPMRNPPNANGDAATERTGSRAASAHPDTGFTMPPEAPAHGAPVRQYINTKVTGVLLEGMKLIAKEQPKDPLRVLGEFLLTRSKELEGTTS
ncbi:hypothetical protein B0T16DRAFT_315683 [Cercophora newfieldiana]|uniref:Dpy-30 domain-containing protein n=1 Tax=Cercophora newfieldiana TaxID=92897 RepID=A0AA39YQK9_9PEZI|nr:hypothetical protein B0T16DRAFT_315683 [Cercophora newfieldiana]